MAAESQVSMILQMDTIDVSTWKNAHLSQVYPDGHHRTLTEQMLLLHQLHLSLPPQPPPRIKPAEQVATATLQLKM
ncbi:MAG TPA: hypothetical protein VMU77_02410 [Acidimicrobiales bacterium]|nr:hypothetical protein [Acidimicrobiales bacterium]